MLVATTAQAIRTITPIQVHRAMLTNQQTITTTAVVLTIHKTQRKNTKISIKHIDKISFKLNNLLILLFCLQN